MKCSSKSRKSAQQALVLKIEIGRMQFSTKTATFMPSNEQNRGSVRRSPALSAVAAQRIFEGFYSGAADNFSQDRRGVRISAAALSGRQTREATRKGGSNTGGCKSGN